MLNRLSRVRSVVGRIASVFGVARARPRRSPPTMRTGFSPCARADRRRKACRQRACRRRDGRRRACHPAFRQRVCRRMACVRQDARNGRVDHRRSRVRDVRHGADDHRDRRGHRVGADHRTNRVPDALHGADGHRDRGGRHAGGDRHGPAGRRNASCRSHPLPSSPDFRRGSSRDPPRHGSPSRAGP